MKRLLLICWVALSLWSCERDRWDPKKDGYDRTTLIYLASDSNLSGYADEKIEAIAQGYTFNKRRSVLIYNDGMRVPELWELKADGSRELIENYDEQQSSASGETLRHVIQRAKTLRPAKAYGLVVFSHAKGWLPKGAFENPTNYPLPGRSSRTIIIDQRNEMEINDFAAAIPDGMFDFIVLEACHTAGIEMLWPLRNKADRIFGSSAELLVCGFTPVYEHSFDLLAKGDIRGFAREAWEEMRTNVHDYANSGTLSLVETAALEPLAAFIKANCHLERAPQINVAMLQRFGRTVSNQQARYLFFDFEQYYGTLLDTDAERAQLAALVAAAVPFREATDGFFIGYSGYDSFMISSHSGMTTYAPQIAYLDLNGSWQASQWGQRIR